VRTEYNSVSDVYSRLNQIPMFGAKGKSAANFSLDAIRLFCENIGNPHLDVPAIHVAGTNGKGTTCRMLASVYQSAGYKTGLFTSPHLVDFRERFMINGEMISEQDLVGFFRKFGDLTDEIPLTYFELSAAIAFWYFSQKHTDIAIYETGLGGRLDATNILESQASVITSIGLDHTDILGNTIDKIAAEKAGIIKPGRPVVTGKLPDEALNVISDIARKKGSAVINTASPVNKKKFTGAMAEQMPLASLSEKINCPVVFAVTHCLSERYPVSLGNLHNGLELWKARYPAGVSFQQLHPDYRWYFDGAHNTEAVKLLMCQMEEIAPLPEWTFVVAMMADKMNREIGKLVSDSGSVFYYSLEFERAASKQQKDDLLTDACELPLNDDKNLTEDWIQKYKSELVIFGGSFYFYQSVKRWLGNIATQ
jgi:dihydrofolate synthase / folylpolyglutamate synthase